MNADQSSAPLSKDMQALAGLAECAVMGYPAAAAAMSAARLAGHLWARTADGTPVQCTGSTWTDAAGQSHDGGHVVITDPGIPRLTAAGRAALADAHNMAAQFNHPADHAGHAANLPWMSIAGFYVAVYVDPDGTLRISVDSDESDEGQWLHTADGVPLLKILVNDTVVHDTSATGHWARVRATVRAAKLMHPDDADQFIDGHAAYIPDPASTKGIRHICDALTLAVGLDRHDDIVRTALMLAAEFQTQPPRAYIREHPTADDQRA